MYQRILNSLNILLQITKGKLITFCYYHLYVIWELNIVK